MYGQILRIFAIADKNEVSDLRGFLLQRKTLQATAFFAETMEERDVCQIHVMELMVPFCNDTLTDHFHRMGCQIAGNGILYYV